jgi:2EXR family
MADLQHFHLFPELPFEIREMVWMSSFPGARSTRARPALEALNWIYHNRKARQILDVTFSYEDSDRIVALRTSRESRQAALSVYRPRVTGWGIIYFCPDRDTVLFAGFETVFETLVSHGSRPASIAQLLMNTCEREASQFADSSTKVEWWEPVLERLGYITREPSLSGQAPPDQERTDRYTPSNIPHMIY